MSAIGKYTAQTICNVTRCLLSEKKGWIYQFSLVTGDEPLYVQISRNDWNTDRVVTIPPETPIRIDISGLHVSSYGDVKWDNWDSGVIKCQSVPDLSSEDEFKARFVGVRRVVSMCASPGVAIAKELKTGMWSRCPCNTLPRIEFDESNLRIGTLCDDCTRVDVEWMMSKK